MEHRLPSPYFQLPRGLEQTLRGEIIEIGAAKIDEHGNVLDTFSIHLRPRIFRKLQHHIAKVTGLTQADLDRGEPILQGLRRFMKWCGPDARICRVGPWTTCRSSSRTCFYATWTRAIPPSGIICKQIFPQPVPPQGGGRPDAGERRHPAGPAHRPPLPRRPVRRALHRGHLPLHRPAPRPWPSTPPRRRPSARASAPPPATTGTSASGRAMWSSSPGAATLRSSAPPARPAGAALVPDDVWLKKGSNSWYTLAQCPHCAGSDSEAGQGVFLRYKLARRGRPALDLRPLPADAHRGNCWPDGTSSAASSWNGSRPSRPAPRARTPRAAAK